MERSEAKKRPADVFLVPRAGGGTGPVPPDESPYLHTGFHFEFHSLNEDAFWHSANTAYSAVPLAERSFQWGYGGRQGA